MPRRLQREAFIEIKKRKMPTDVGNNFSNLTKIRGL
jgi:hypothetical protein